LGMFWLSVGIVGKKVKAVPFLIYAACSSAAYLFAVCVVSWLLPEDIQNAWVSVLCSLICYPVETAALGLVIKKCYGVPFSQGMTAAMLGHFIIYTADDVVSQAAGTYSPLFDRMYIYTFITIVIPKLWAFLVAFLAAYILRKSGFYRYFETLFAGKVRTALMMAVSFLLMFVWTAVDWFFPEAEPNALYAVFFFSLITVVLLCVQFLAMYTAGQEKIHMQEETIAQQQAHMELLEELQQEIRAFRHDVTNLFSGLSLQAQEGDLDGIQQFMKKTSSYFDEKLGNEIRQMDCLNNIKIYPVRSLLATKLTVMRQKHIQSTLEVFYPVVEKQMVETPDLLRGLGILIDNAIEAVPGENGQIRLVLLQEEKELYIAVVNNYAAEPDLKALSGKGYTTKGNGHGTGLSSYRRIISRYPGCITRTYLRDGFFVQELRLPSGTYHPAPGLAKGVSE
ncbi:MAG: GHKL domain-containing protein, partial [Lachnospiraceae bacterium]|nr:GHKL domain-containing protein [Lachnospiraceae bacterium]